LFTADPIGRAMGLSQNGEGLCMEQDSIRICGLIPEDHRPSQQVNLPYAT
jgi:hypothetical protein